MIEGLNTLRYFAFLSIFLFHTIPGFEKGFLGVDFFFVLSAFLLTWLGFIEIEKHGTFSLKNFFMRRVLRIFPLYFLIVALSFLLVPELGKLWGFTPKMPENSVVYWLFLSNYDFSDCFYPLKFLWSIAVEEQFYLGFTLFGIIIFRRTYAVVAILMLMFTGFMIFAAYYQIPTYTHTLTHLSKFGIGILIGTLYYRNIELKQPVLIVFPLSLIGILIIENEFWFHLNSSLFFGSIVVLTISYWNYIGHFFPFKLTEYLGKYTYGLYIYSGVIIVFISVAFGSMPATSFLIEFVMLHGVAILSYHLFEQQFLKLKRYFR